MQIHFTDLCAGKECKLFYLHLCLFIFLFVCLFLCYFFVRLFFLFLSFVRSRLHSVTQQPIIRNLHP